MKESIAIRKFLIKAKKVGYAAGGVAFKIQEPDGSKTIVFEEGRFKYHDNYFGGEPYGGREVLFVDTKPYWMMVYYGWVTKNFDIKSTYEFLQNALLSVTEDCFLRGMTEYAKNDWSYCNQWFGGFEKFEGIERIFRNNAQAYEAKYLGGLVDVF